MEGTGKTAYIILCEGEFDQVCETETQAKQEIQWLRKRGFSVKLHRVPWDKQDEFITSLG